MTNNKKPLKTPFDVTLFNSNQSENAIFLDLYNINQSESSIFWKEFGAQTFRLALFVYIVRFAVKKQWASSWSMDL